MPNPRHTTYSMLAASSGDQHDDTEYNEGWPTHCTATVLAEDSCIAHVRALATLLIGCSFQPSTIAEAMRLWADENTTYNQETP
jgi:hypothetical protein